MNELDIRKWWDIFKKNGNLTEIRILDGKRTYSGYFKNIDNIISAIKPFESANIYFTLNCIDESCYGREQNERLIMNPKNTTSDSDIIARDFIMVDIDPKRVAGTNATNQELERAHLKAVDIYRFLKDNGFNEPIIAMSGNGWHIHIPVALKASQENTDLVKRFLLSLAKIFTDKYCDIDLKVFNNSRICKLFGTRSNKGADIENRPKRYSSIVKVPDEIKVNHIDYIKKIADMFPQQEEERTAYNDYGTKKFDLDEFIAKYNIQVSQKIEVADGTRYILDHCLFNDSHRGRDAMIFKANNGAISYFCFHSSCSNKKWRDVREMFEPNYRNKQEYTPRRFTPYTKIEKQEIVNQLKDNDKGNVWQGLDEIEDEDRSKIITIPSGIIQYDKECCGFDKPSLSVWSGSNGSAKSTLLNQVALNAMNQDFKVAIYSGELRGKKLKRWIMYQAAGKAYNVKSKYNDYDYYTPQNIKDKIALWAKDKLFNYNTQYSHNIEQVCKEIENICKKQQVDMVIVDNLSCLDIENLDGTINEQQKTAIKMMLRLANELEVALHIVIHPRKSLSYLTKDDISGSKTITDLADCVFIVHRWNLATQKAANDYLPSNIIDDINISGATNLVEVIKHREFGEAEGHIYKLYFEPESRRLKNSIDEHIIYGWQESPIQQELPQLNEFDNNDFENSTEIEDCPF